MTDAEVTVAAVRAKRWEVVRLRGKKPLGPHWQTTKDPAAVAAWLEAGSNATTMYRDMGMTYWLEKADAEMRESG